MLCNAGIGVIPIWETGLVSGLYLKKNSEAHYTILESVNFSTVFILLMIKLNIRPGGFGRV